MRQAQIDCDQAEETMMRERELARQQMAAAKKAIFEAKKASMAAEMAQKIVKTLESTIKFMTQQRLEQTKKHKDEIKKVHDKFLLNEERLSMILEDTNTHIQGLDVTVADQDSFISRARKVMSAQVELEKRNTGLLKDKNELTEELDKREK